MPIIHPLGIQVQLLDVQTDFDEELWAETPAAGAFSEWALCYNSYIAAGEECRFWDNKGEPSHLTNMPMCPLISCAMKQYVFVGRDLLRSFDKEQVPEQLPVLTLPCDFIFTKVDSLGWMSISIDPGKRVTLYTSLCPGASVDQEAFDEFKKKHIVL